MKTNKILMVVLAFVLSLAGSASADLVAHYEFEGNATDSAGTYDGTLVGDPTYGPGVFGWAINLDGVDDYVNCGNNSVFNMVEGITVAAWVNINAVDKAWQAIVTKGDSAWRLSTSGMQRKFQFGVTGPPDWRVVDGLTEIPAGEWHHVCGTFDRDDALIRLYLDGELDNVASYDGNISANTSDVCIGENPEASGRYWNGLIDDVRIYDSELGLAEVQALVNVPLGSGEAFTYEGRLLDEGSSADGPYDFQFKLYDAPVLGTQLGDTIDISDVDVIDGHFVAELDFGSELFDGNQRWLQVSVRPGASTDSYTILNPRIAVTPTPYALHAFSSVAGHSLDAADGSPEDVVYVDDEGNVGIGTTNPSSKLHVEEDRLGSATVTIHNENDAGSERLHFGTDPDYDAGIVVLGSDSTSSQGRWTFFNNKTSGHFDWLTSSSIKMTLANNGNLGIGTTVPSSKLHVEDNTTGGGDVAIRIHNQNDAGREALYFGTSPGSDAGITVFGPTHSTNPDEWTFFNNRTSGHFDWLTNNTVRMTLANSGNLGIGTPNPEAKLHIMASNPEVRFEESDQSNKKWHIAGYNSDLVFSETEVADRMAIQAGGNVGIGTSNPSDKLHVENSSGDNSIKIRSQSGGESSLKLFEGSDYGFEFLYDGVSDRLDLWSRRFADNEDVRMTWLKNGNVGIGTTSPSHKLTVRGNLLLESESTGVAIVELGEGLDYAEGFDVSEKGKIEAGSVLIIDADNPGKLALSNNPYDTKVAGIVAGAQGQGSGVRLGAGEFDYDVALAGRVYCNVDATEEGIEPGDLLTSSTTPGYAMKAADYARAQGAILGKAMERLEKGQRGQILVLVTLQ